MIASIHVDEFGYLVVAWKEGGKDKIALTRSSLLELHAQALWAALYAKEGPEEPPLEVVEP